MSPETKQLLTMIAGRKQGRVSFNLLERDKADALAAEALEAGYLRRRRLGYDQGYQLTPAGRQYLAGAAE
jgi:hypothetical protein